MKLAQTLIGNWIITVTNPEEGVGEVQLAEFEIVATGDGSPARHALERAAASTFAQLTAAFPGLRPEARVESHDADNKSRMAELCTEFGATLA